MEHANCSKCRYSARVIGSSHHQSCNSPVVEELKEALGGSMFEIISLLGGSYNPDFQIAAAFKGQVVQLNPHGVKHGWASWPFNFDEIWITSCNTYEEKSNDQVGVQGI